MARRQRKRLDEDELAGIIRSELEEADGSQSDELDRVRALALDRYYGKPRGDEVAGRSKVLSTDVADMVEAVVADIAPSLTRAGVAAFTPISEEDEKEADLETAAVEDAVFQENDGFRELTVAVKEALLLRSCWVRVEVETDETTHEETLRGLDGESIGIALQPTSQTEEVELLAQEQIGARTETGEPIYDVTIRRTFTHEKLCIEAVPVEDISYSADWRRTSVDGVRFLARFERIERGELIEMGVSKALADELPPSPVEVRHTAVSRQTTHTTHSGGKEPSTELIDCHRVFVRVDMDGDGVPELWRCLYANERILLRDEVAFVPYVNGTAVLRSFRVDGVSLYDRLEQIESVKTGALRQWMDNLSATNNVRAGLVENQVNIGDWQRSKPGGYVRIKSPNAIVPLNVGEAGPSALALLEYSDKMRSERGGASLDLQSAEAQIAGHTAGGTDRQYTAREKAGKMMALTIAETLVRDLYRLVHRTMRTQFSSVLDLKRNGEWQRTDPRTWKERSRLTCNVGRTLAEKLRRAAALERVVGYQERLIGAGFGGIITDVSKAHNALVDWCEANDLEAPEQYWIDPTTQEAQQAATRRANEQRQRTAEQERANAALLRLSLNFERWKEEQENQRHADEIRFKYLEAALESEAKEAELVGEATKDLAVAQMRTAGGGSGD